MLTVYIAGPISGMPDYNKPAFAHATTLWQKAGWNVINPIQLDNGVHTHPWLWYMRRDIKLLVDCDAIALLPGWTDSKGASVENRLMELLGLPSFSALHPAPYEQHAFIDPGNVCCLRPDYVHEAQWRDSHAR